MATEGNFYAASLGGGAIDVAVYVRIVRVAAASASAGACDVDGNCESVGNGGANGSADGNVDADGGGNSDGEQATPFSATSDSHDSGGTPSRAPGTPSCSAPAGSSLAPPAGDTASISMLTVAPALKRQGLAKALLAWVEAHARAEHCVALEASVVSVKPWLLAFYERSGFTVVGAEDWPPVMEHELLLDCHFHQVRKLLV